MDLLLAGRVALVTGASKGIGLAITRTLLEEGAWVAAVSRATTPALDELARPNLHHIAADLMDPNVADTVVTKVKEAFGGIDIVVNNAGGPPPGMKLPQFGFLSTTDETWQQIFEFNLFSTVRITRAAIPMLLERGGGSIINISSGSARRAAPMNVDYNAAKAGMNNLTKALSEEFAPQGIRVNTISPGPTLTSWWTDQGGAAQVIAEQFGTDAQSVIEKSAPEMMQLSTGRLVKPEEIADVVALLASPRSASTTGADFAIDAGFLKEI